MRNEWLRMRNRKLGMWKQRTKKSSNISAPRLNPTNFSILFWIIAKVTLCNVLFHLKSEAWFICCLLYYATSFRLCNHYSEVRNHTSYSYVFTIFGEEKILLHWRGSLFQCVHVRSQSLIPSSIECISIGPQIPHSNF